MFRYKTKPYEHQRIALEKSYNKRTLDTLWRWAVVNQRFCSTTLHGYTTTNLSTQQLSLRQRVCIETGKYQKYRLTYQKTLNQKLYVWSANPNKGQRESLSEGVEKTRKFRILLVNVEAFGASKKVSQYLDLFVQGSTFYLRSMRAQLLRTPRPSGLKLWLSLVRVQRTNVSLPDRPLLNRLWISTHNVGSWTNDCWDSTVTIPSKDGTLLQGLSAWVRTAFSRLWAIVTWKNCRDKLAGFSYRVTKEEALDLPDKIYTVREVGVHKRTVEVLSLQSRQRLWLCLMMDS